MIKKQIKALTQYKKFSLLKSLDAANERILILKSIVKVKSNESILFTARTKPWLILSAAEKLYKKIGPRSIGINPTPVCDRNCVFCSSRQRNRINIRKGIEITKDKLDALFQSFVNLQGKGCVLVGGGEPLLACDGKIDEVISKYDLRYGCNTNGVNLYKFINPSIMKRFAWISVSIIAHNRLLYNKVAGLGLLNKQFDILHNNLKRCLELKGRKFPYFSAKIMICRENYLFVGKIYNYIKELGFKDIALRCVNNFELEKKYKDYQFKPQDVELSFQQKEKLGKILEHETDLSKAIIDNIVNNIGKKQKDNFDKFFVYPSVCWNIVLGLIVNIDTDGEVYLCNPRLGMKEASVGNINHTKFDKVWQSKRHIKVVRQTYLNFDKKCYLSKCRHYRVNQAIELFLENKLSLEDLNHAYARKVRLFLCARGARG